MVHILGNKNTIFDHFISEIRDVEIQKDRMRFRRNMERLGEIFAYEISKCFKYENKKIVTSLGVANVPVFQNKIILATILRAGLPLHQGLLNYFDNAGNAFVSAYRKYRKDRRFDIQVEYTSTPELNNSTLILSDPMVATGASMVLAYKELLTHGKPSHTHIVTVLASIEGVNYVKKHISSRDVTLWVGSVDEELTAQAFIVPGLGDAGDLAFGNKL